MYSISGRVIYFPSPEINEFLLQQSFACHFHIIISFAILDFGPALGNLGAGIAQSVQRLPMGWTTEGSEFKSREGQEFSLLHVVQTSSGVHPTSYAMGTWDSFPEEKRREADHSPPNSAEVDLYIHSPIRLHGIVLN
jgi:hypothetical protein